VWEVIVLFSMGASFCLYMGIYIISAGLIHVGSKKKSPQNRLLLFVGILIPSIFAGIRYNVGTDWRTYLSIYNYAHCHSLFDFLSQQFGREVGTWIFAQCAGILGGYQWFFFLYAFAMLAIVVHVLRTQYPKVPLGQAVFVFLLGTFTGGFNIMRQSLAACIIFAGMKYVFERKPGKYGLSILIASAVHTSAFICLPIYILWNGGRSTVSRWKKTLIFAGGLFFVVFYGQLISFLSKIPGLSWFSTYADSSVAGMNRSFFLKLLILGVILLFRKKLIRVEPRNKLFIVLVYLSVMLEFLGFYSAFYKRVNVYFALSEILLLVQIPNTLKQPERTIARTFVYLYSISMFILSYWVLRQSGILPYILK